MIIENDTPDIPEWVPLGARKAAHILLNQKLPAQIRAAIIRLLCDLRMKTVWTELTNRKREGHASGPDPIHASTLPPAVESWHAMAEAERLRAAEYRELGDEAAAQLHEQRAAMLRAKSPADTSEQPSKGDKEQLALAMIFSTAVALYGQANRTIAQKDLNTRIHDLRSKGETDIADALMRHADLPENARMIVQRRRTDPRLEAFIELLALQMQQTFGAALPSTIATITNVMFEGKRFDRNRVRAVLKSRPGRPAA